MTMRMVDNRAHWPIIEQTMLSSGIDGLFMVVETDSKEFDVHYQGVMTINTEHNGLLYRFGKWKAGLGLVNYTEPTLVSIPDSEDNQRTSIIAMAHSLDHILLLTSKGLIFAFDEKQQNASNNLGPMLISGTNRFISVCCGMNHCAALAEDGLVWCWGQDCYGQTGITSSNEYQSKPSLVSVPLTSEDCVKEIACGALHTLALTKQGIVYGWGFNRYGQFGVTNCEMDASDSYLVPSKSFYRSDDENQAQSTYHPTRIEPTLPVISIAAGRNHSLLLTRNGLVFACGENRYGQLGREIKDNHNLNSNPTLLKVDCLPPISQIAAHFAADLSVAITADRTCFVWGQIGMSSWIPFKLPPHYSTIDSAFVLFSSYRSTPNSVSVQGPRSNRLSERMSRLLDNCEYNPDVLFVFPGGKQLCAHRSILSTSSTHFSQIWPNHHCMAQSSLATSVSIPIQNYSYQSFRSYLSVLYSDSFETISDEMIPELTSLATSYQEEELLKNCIELNQMSHNHRIESTSYWPILQQIARKWWYHNDGFMMEQMESFMVMGENGDAVLMLTRADTGNAYWFGQIKFGKDGKTKRATEPTSFQLPDKVVSLAQGKNHVLMLNNLGQIYAFGLNRHGQLAMETTQDDLPPDYNVNFEPRLIVSPYRFVSIQCGSSHSVALTDDGNVFAWGANDKGQIGAELICTSHPTLNPIPKLCDKQTVVVSIACGGDHTLALTKYGLVYAWGCNDYGQLGTRNWNKRENYIATPTLVDIPFRFKQIAAGSNHSLMLAPNGNVYACGKNQFGQLGRERTFESNPTLTKVIGLPPVCQIGSHFASHISIGIATTGKCYVWGNQFDDRSLSVPLLLSSPFYSTIHSALAFLSPQHKTPNSIRFQGSKPDRLPDRMERLFDSGQYSDVQFVFSGEDRTIHAHRSILQSSSHYFDRMFSQNWCPIDPNPSSSIETIPITEHSYRVYHCYLRFLYTDCFQLEPSSSCSSCTLLCELFELAHCHLETNLERHCLIRMIDVIWLDNCCQLYQIADRYQLAELHYQLVRFVAGNSEEVLASSAYQSMDSHFTNKLTNSIQTIHSN